MTTRRLRRWPAPPWRGRIGRFGLLDPESFAITSSSVETGQGRLDFDGLAERAVERPACGGALEARQPPAGVSAAPRPALAGNELPLVGDEPEKLRLRSLPPAADAAPDRGRQAAGVSSSVGTGSGVAASASGTCSIGMPAGTCSGAAYCGWTVSRST